ncbi:MAG: helicase-related protein [Candidatus Xenobia bacterium]
MRISDRISEQAPKRFVGWCPTCGSEGSLWMLASRAATLSSVAITHTFVSPYNDDRKLIAFTDSVQDASHRAGFFGSRTYRFNLRTAIQTVVTAHPDLTLAEFQKALIEDWCKRLGESRAIVAFTPPDLYDLQEYTDFRRREGKGGNDALLQCLEKRVSWEVTMELGLSARVGRTLENTVCATTRIVPQKLRAAAEALLRDVKEHLMVGQRDWDVETVQYFLEGILTRLRVRGGIAHPLLNAYVGSEGGWYLLSKKHNELISRFSKDSVFPRFLLPRDGHKIFDGCMSLPGSDGWYRDWSVRSLGLDRREAGLNDLYRRALSRMVEHGLLVELPCGNRSGKAYGIDPRSLQVTPQVQRLVCTTCGTPVTLAQDVAVRHIGKRCMRYRCSGCLIEREWEANYYARIYNSGQVTPILTAEHTGLLERTSREHLEEQFKSGRTPGAPNLIVCTPTLELGIDIGDLSAVMACSVPPSTANYLQRVGRGGRKTGNALTLTLALMRPHDIYFFTEPREMLAGDVLPPGCFLDAPEMLKRQLVAHAMDLWARQETKLPHIPRKTMFCLGRKAFPTLFIDYYRAHRTEVIASFLSMFGEIVVGDNRARLEAFAQGEEVPSLMEAAFQRIQQEIAEMDKVRKKLDARLQEIEKKPETSESPETESKELKGALKGLVRLKEELLGKYPLNVLTDAGVLPNYAFPEAGVHLHSVIRIPSKEEKGKAGYRAREYVRPASSAIREMAPYNHFYAEGRRVTITQIDIGTPARPLVEKWRLCPDCHHMERLTGPETEPATACSRCGSPGWADAGQLRTLVPFKRAWSLSNLLDSLTVDESDDRDMRDYEVLDLIDVAPEHWRQAWAIESLPFGYQLLHGLTLR